MPGWLPLLNYSTKYNISLSTLRRRIKSRSIEFKLDQGKYFISDSEAQAPVSVATHGSPPPKREAKVFNEPTQVSGHSSNEISHSNFVEASVLTSANRLVEEIKSAYAKILQEKEEQISQLKEEIVDLRMLVRILEDTSKQPATEVEQKKSGQDSTRPDSADYLFSDFQSRDI
jgi:hypothetical protein